LDDTQQRLGATRAHSFAYARPTLATTSTADQCFCFAADIGAKTSLLLAPRLGGQ
jgi:hypothetical protein